jgi:hypothetical protein
LRYTIDPDKLVEFEHYAGVWMRLIEKYGGRRHGYFVPGAGPTSEAFSFPGIGDEGPENVAVPLFSFPTVAAYESYRREVTNDPECLAVTRHYEQTKCFTKYERTFMRTLPRAPRT